MKKTIKILITFMLFFAITNISLAQEHFPKHPQNLEETKKMQEEIFETGKKTLPGIIKEIWYEQVIPVWNRMNNWFQLNIWEKIRPRIAEEGEKRKEIIKEEFEKEKEELKEELPEIKKSLWERFLELWRYKG